MLQEKVFMIAHDSQTQPAEAWYYIQMNFRKHFSSVWTGGMITPVRGSVVLTHTNVVQEGEHQVSTLDSK